MEMTIDDLQRTVGGLFLQNQMLTQKVAQLETELKALRSEKEKENGNS